MMEETKKNKTQQYLPHELIIQILLRLPVKCLLHFKCVCKLWLTLICDTHFANSHFQITATHTPTVLFLSNSAPPGPQSIEIERSTHSDSDTDFANSHFQLATATPTYTIRFISHPYLLTPSIDFQESLNPDIASTSLNLNFTPFESYSYIQVKGSCRGFLLLHCYCQQMLNNNNNIYIFNPSTGVHKKIPLSPFASNLDEDEKFICYLDGFGYDQSTDDYLLVSLSHDDQNTAKFSPHVVFFSFRANTWKEIEGTHFPYMNSSISFVNHHEGLLYNGAIHWLAFRHDLKRYVILVFDLMERKLEEIHLPDDVFSVYDPCTYCLWVFGEFLSVWDPSYNTVEIWVMKEYKMHSSWTKMLVLPTDGLPYEYFNPLCSTKSGDIIGMDGGTGWVKYNDKGHLLDHYDCNYPLGSQATMYIESLFSLPADNEQA
ncbi:F-box/kelch-repeat protein At3g06240-like [Trifolium pratense]|uniref:F-box/kelch-repeat protein At3g06240-like n=1 Tax=Trifolium pratense TaxID=57577 RepID=UPI001E69141C|nr:F-box/kelch-repeat protein At3g06240-like [Trifolium pratense]